MSNHNSARDQTLIPQPDGTNDNYHSGTIWEGSMFPPGPRDPQVWGPQNPMEFVPSAGPFDDVDGEQSWRVSNGGRDVYSGEMHIRSRAPNAQQKHRRNQFWQQHDARGAQVATGSGQKHHVQEPAGAARFLDALPISSSSPLVLKPTPAPAPASGNTTQHHVAPETVQTPVRHQLQQPSGLSPALAAQSSSDVDGDYEVDDEQLPGTPQGQSLPATTEDKEQLPDSTPPKTSSPRGIDDWDDDNLLSLWKFKVIRKKGYEPMLAHFPNQTTESIHETWVTHRKRCQELGAAWRAAGKPARPVAEWFEE